MDKYFEVNFNGFNANYHNYGGLAAGNQASIANGGRISKPREGALQAVVKAVKARELGLVEAFLPPQMRPDWAELERAGFKGCKQDILRQAYEQNPQLLSKVYSSASMWTANAATIAPSIDTQNSKLNILPANLISHLHRKLELPQTTNALAHIFNGDLFNLCTPQKDFGDEGAANHLRFAPAHSDRGLHVFIYGTNGIDGPTKYSARQTLSASQDAAKRLQLKEDEVLFLRQNADVIDQGVFHNDVISVANENVFLYHEKAFADQDAMQRIDDKYRTLNPGKKLNLIEIKDSELSVSGAVKNYFFNSQIVTLPNGGMAIIAPENVRDDVEASALMQKIVDNNSNPIKAVHYTNLTQSMQNGGGPACLRLRLVMNDKEMAAVKNNANVFLTDELVDQIQKWIIKYYREELQLKDLADIELYNETTGALAELSTIMRIPLL